MRARNTLAAVISDSGGNATSLTKNGVGAWQLTGNSTYNGPTTVNGGTLTFANNTISGNGDVNVNNSSQMWVNNASFTGNGNVNINNNRQLFVVNNGTFTGRREREHQRRRGDAQ